MFLNTYDSNLKITIMTDHYKILYNDLTRKLLLVGLILLQGVTGPTLLVLGYLSNNKKEVYTLGLVQD